MSDKIVSFFMNHGLKLLIAGFSISAIGCIIMFMQAQHQVSLPNNLGFGITLAGFSVYIVSRIGMVVSQRQARRTDSRTVEGPDKKEGL